ncbi:MAG: phosphoribosyltransferase, partial [Chloroflexi bacterium]|nr:phosphoribosyltransferase [Chloroflexota bacterium]
MRQEILTWNDVEKLIDHLIPQFEVEFQAMIMITRGGVIPGGMLAEALNLTMILTAAVDFPAEMESEKQKEKSRLLAWP